MMIFYANLYQHREKKNKFKMCFESFEILAPIILWGNGMIASGNTFRPHPGRVIRDLFRLLNAVFCIVRNH